MKSHIRVSSIILISAILGISTIAFGEMYAINKTKEEVEKQEETISSMQQYNERLKEQINKEKQLNERKIKEKETEIKNISKQKEELEKQKDLLKRELEKSEILKNQYKKELLEKPTIEVKYKPVTTSSGYVSSGYVNTNDIRQKSNLTEEQFEKMVSDVPSFKGMGKYIKTAEENYNVNGVVLIGMAMHESDRGKSKIAREKKNIFGERAYDSCPYECAYTYNHIGESVLSVAGLLSNEYLHPKGSFYNGYSLEGVNVRYASDTNWHIGVTRHIQERLKML